MDERENARQANHKQRDAALEERAKVQAQIKEWHQNNRDMRVMVVDGRIVPRLNAMGMHPELRVLEKRDAELGEELSRLQYEDAQLLGWGAKAVATVQRGVNGSGVAASVSGAGTITVEKK